jgi:SSS family solute:Na+ symporter
MRVPVTMAHFLPIGIRGLLATIMLFASFTCHDTYMHSWGTIFIQDVYMPIKRRALEPHEHIRLLRWSIVGVAVFAFFFSLLYPPNEPIFMFFAITGTIWAAGAGAAIIGGLYWKRGTTAGAYCAVTLGAILGSAVLVGRPIYKSIFHGDIPVNNQQIFFIAACAASIVYVVVSLLTSRKGREFNLDRMLCRGEYASACKSAPTEKAPGRWQQLVGITKEFSFSDKILAVALVVWNGGWATFFLVVTALNLMFNIGTEWWARYWHTYILIYFSIGVPVTVWFAVGGIIDIKALFKALATDVRDHSDDGRVTCREHASEQPDQLQSTQSAVMQAQVDDE